MCPSGGPQAAGVLLVATKTSQVEFSAGLAELCLVNLSNTGPLVLQAATLEEPKESCLVQCFERHRLHPQHILD